MNMPRVGMGDFVAAAFPEPVNPLLVQPNWDPSVQNGMGDFVAARFPEPNNPIYRPAGLSGCGGGDCGCGCGGGMGAVSVPTWAASLPSPLNAMWGPLPAVYWGGLALAAIVLPMAFRSGGRRR